MEPRLQRSDPSSRSVASVIKRALLLSALPAYTVDLPGGKFGGGYQSWEGHMMKSFRRARQRVSLFWGGIHTALKCSRASAANSAGSTSTTGSV
jgi:hypothetical protein